MPTYEISKYLDELFFLRGESSNYRVAIAAGCRGLLCNAKDISPRSIIKIRDALSDENARKGNLRLPTDIGIKWGRQILETIEGINQLSRPDSQIARLIESRVLDYRIALSLLPNSFKDFFIEYYTEHTTESLQKSEFESYKNPKFDPIFAKNPEFLAAFKVKFRAALLIPITRYQVSEILKALIMRMFIDKKQYSFSSFSEAWKFLKFRTYDELLKLITAYISIYQLIKLKPHLKSSSSLKEDLIVEMHSFAIGTDLIKEIEKTPESTFDIVQKLIQQHGENTPAVLAELQSTIKKESNSFVWKTTEKWAKTLDRQYGKFSYIKAISLFLVSFLVLMSIVYLNFGAISYFSATTTAGILATTFISAYRFNFISLTSLPQLSMLDQFYLDTREELILQDLSEQVRGSLRQQRSQSEKNKKPIMIDAPKLDISPSLKQPASSTTYAEIATSMTEGAKSKPGKLKKKKDKTESMETMETTSSPTQSKPFVPEIKHWIEGNTVFIYSSRYDQADNLLDLTERKTAIKLAKQEMQNYLQHEKISYKNVVYAKQIWGKNVRGDSYSALHKYEPDLIKYRNKNPEKYHALKPAIKSSYQCPAFHASGLKPLVEGVGEGRPKKKGLTYFYEAKTLGVTARLGGRKSHDTTNNEKNGTLYVFDTNLPHLSQ